MLFLIDLSSRRVEIAGVAREAQGIWISQIARNLSDTAEGFLVGKQYLIYDRARGSRQSFWRRWRAVAFNR